MEEIELLNKIKEQLIDKSEFKVNQFNKTYIIVIDLDDWHKIFKTEEYNEKKKK